MIKLYESGLQMEQIVPTVRHGSVTHVMFIMSRQVIEMAFCHFNHKSFQGAKSKVRQPSTVNCKP